MSQFTEEGPLREAAILTRAIENVLRKLIRLLLGRMSLTKLQEMIRMIFVEEAESRLKQECPGKNVSLTKLALMTGLDTRTLAKVKLERAEGYSIHENSRFLKGFTPGFKVLDMWLNDQRYASKQSGEPMDLAISGEKSSFENLVNHAVTARGVTSHSILERLVENKMISLDEEAGLVRLNKTGIVFISNDELDMIDIGFEAVANLISTIAHNVQNASNSENRFFQRSCWTFRLDPLNRPAFRVQMREFLQNANKSAKSAIAPYEESDDSIENITAGISMFYFEENSAS